jgi:hypothetical protein
MRRDTLPGQSTLLVPPMTLVRIHDCGGREREGTREGKYTWGAVAASSVLLFCFLTLMTSFSSTNPMLSKPLAEINHSIKSALLISDVKKLTPRIV